MVQKKRRILVTGAHGFIGKNLVVHLREIPETTVVEFVRGDDVLSLEILTAQVDAVVHLAGENRPKDEGAFLEVNVRLTSVLCSAIEKEYLTNGRHVPLVFASSAQASLDNPYGRSKLAGEEVVKALSQSTGNPCVIFRLPGVFGKWCKPNYNSVVATFCYNIARGLPVTINHDAPALRLVYVDDVVMAILAALEEPVPRCVTLDIKPEYSILLSDLADKIYAFGKCRTTLVSEKVGSGLLRALYATYMSYLPCDKIFYELPQYADSRGVFVEMLKTSDNGQFSYFTAHPGITRGGHYHHSKTEKFLVIKGKALFRFRHVLSEEFFELQTSGDKPQVVDIVPGWAHDITNVGVDELVVILWANESLNRQRMDTVPRKIQQ